MKSVKILIKKVVKALGLYDAVMKSYLKRRKNKTKKAFKLYGQEALEKAREAFKGAHEDFWLDFGTLLGAIREKDFIAHDFDIDIGTFSENSSKIEEELTKHGFKKLKEYYINGRLAEQSYDYKGAGIDIFFYEKDEENMWCYVFYPTNNVAYEDIEGGVKFRGWGAMKTIMSYKGLTTLEFKGKTYTIPGDPHLYLTENYGNYMVPNDSWDYVENAINIEDVGVDNIIGYQYK